MEHSEQYTVPSLQSVGDEFQRATRKKKRGPKNRPNRNQQKGQFGYTTVKVSLKRLVNGDREKKAKITEMFRSDVRGYSEVAAESSLYLCYHLLSNFKDGHFPTKYKHQKRKRKKRHTMNKIRK